MATTKTSLQSLLFEANESKNVPNDANTCFQPEVVSGDSNYGAEQKSRLREIEKLDSRLSHRFRKQTFVHQALSRQLVSFQANKQRPGFRWYKYKEAFSAPLVDYLLSRYGIEGGTILDPFAGAGTALFVASDAGVSADGIELLPIGQEIIRARLLIRAVTPAQFQRLNRWTNPAVWANGKKLARVPDLQITAGAYPPRTISLLEKYLGALVDEDPAVASILRFALLCVLEAISYTRKDGQYLRWDYRSGRQLGEKRFDKGRIHEFQDAVSSKITEIVNDISSGSLPINLFARRVAPGKIRLIPGSCLEVLPGLRSNSYSAIVTSPPYCNRYDYTRTYALELAILGAGEKTVSALRQEMLSCTVENRAKDLSSINPRWQAAIEAADSVHLLQSILSYLDWCRDASLLNNNGIARMVRGYFYEMACVIYECGRALKPGSPLIMVNDNVRYAGASVSVDLLLSALAEQLGFRVESILVLPSGKGNSSQQMGEHGRDVLRKCVYIWRKNSCRTVGT